jgi:transposase
LWLRAHQDLATEAIAQAVGLSVSHVRRVWSEYLRGGLAAGQGRPKGGRRHQNLTLAQERSLLTAWQQPARRGQLVTARSIKVDYEKRLRRAVPDSTVCRLLARHQWRRVTPRPKHPKDAPAARAAFKKTSGQSGRRCGWIPAPTVAADV